MFLIKSQLIYCNHKLTSIAKKREIGGWWWKPNTKTYIGLDVLRPFTYKSIYVKAYNGKLTLIFRTLFKYYCIYLSLHLFYNLEK